MSTMPYPPPVTPPPAPDRGGAFFDSVRRGGLARSPDRWIGGVAGGIAYRLGVDPLIVRGVFVVLGLFGGLALVAYGVAWALLPEASDGRVHLQEALRGRFNAALAGAAAFVLLGLGRPVAWFDQDRWLPGWVLGLAWVGLTVTVIVLALTFSGRAARGAPAVAPGPPPPSPEPNGSAAMHTAPTTHTPTPYPAYGYPPGGAGSASGGSGGPTGWTPPPMPPARPGPGSVTVGIVLALVFFAGAGVLLAHRAGLMTGSAALTFAGLTLVVLGLGVLVSGARGRRAGALAGIAVVVALLAVPAAAVTTLLPDWPRTVSDGPPVLGDVVWAPMTVKDAEEGFSYAVGEGRVDLTGPDWVEDRAEGPAEVRVEAGAGSTTVVLPSGVPLEVRADVGAGEVSSLLSPGWTRSATWETRDRTPRDAPATANGRIERTEAEGTDVRVTLRSPASERLTDEELALVVTVESGIGDITIEEER